MKKLYIKLKEIAIINYNELSKYINICPIMEILIAYIAGLLQPLTAIILPYSILYYIAVFGILFLLKHRKTVLCIFIFGLIWGHIHVLRPWDTYRKYLYRDNCSATLRIQLLEDPVPIGLSKRAMCRIKEIRTDDKWHLCKGKAMSFFPGDTALEYLDTIEVNAAFIKLPADDSAGNYYRTLGISHRLNVIESSAIPTESKIDKLLKSYARLRKQFATALTTGIKDKECAGMYEAMMLGMRERLSEETRKVFIKSASVHLFSISGLHVGLLSLFILRFFKSLGISFKYQALLALPVLLSYVILSGSAPSAMRSFYMAAAVSMASLIMRRKSSENGLAMSGLVLLLYNPLYLLHTGFQFSFILVLTLLRGFSHGAELTRIICEKTYWLPHHTTRRNLWRHTSTLLGAFISGIIAWYGSCGLMMRSNCMLSVGSIIVNFIISPLTTLLVGATIPKILLHYTLPILSSYLGIILELCLKCLLIASRFGAQDGLYIPTYEMSLWLCLCYYAFLLIALSGLRPNIVRLIAIATSTCIILFMCCLRQGDSFLLISGSLSQKFPTIVLLCKDRYPLFLQCGDYGSVARACTELKKYGLADKLNICIADGSATNGLYAIPPPSICSIIATTKTERSRNMTALLKQLKFNGINCSVSDANYADGISIEQTALKNTTEFCIKATLPLGQISISNLSSGMTNIRLWNGREYNFMPSSDCAVQLIPL